jgi:hypothetical protein
MRSDNLRRAPGWVTPDLVRRILALAATPIGPDPVPVVAVKAPKPKLTIVQSTPAAAAPPNPPAAPTGEPDAQPGSPTPLSPAHEHARRADESEAANRGPTCAASPLRR